MKEKTFGYKRMRVELYVAQPSGSKSARQKEEKLALLPKNNQSSCIGLCSLFI